MTLTMRRAVLSLSVLFFCTVPLLSAQEPAAPHPGEQALAKAATKVLLRFAGMAKSKKLRPMEKQAYDLILSEYDPENKRARKALNYKKNKKDGTWELAPRRKRTLWKDKANRKQRFEVQQEWRTVREKLAAEHRELGMGMRDAAGELTELGRKHIDKAILYDPLDQAAHEALGHKGWDNNGITYFGTEEQIAFMKKMKEIETFALMLAQRDYEAEIVDEIPEELNKLGLEFYGAKSQHFTVFTRGSQENADDLVQWGERALDFVEFVCGKRGKRVVQHARRSVQATPWTGFLWTQLEMDDFRDANPELATKEQKFRNIFVPTPKGAAEVVTALMPSSMQDKMIAEVFHDAFRGMNDGILEGVHHAATWFLKSTCITKYGAEPEGTATEYDLVLPDGANWWMREMRNQAIARTDAPLNVIPRTRLSKFPPENRLKAWSFATWAMAAYPEEWLDFLDACPSDKIPFPEEIDKIGLKVFGKSLNEVEDAWRDWASGRGVTAAATGYGPPLLPEFPSDVELDGLDRMNEVRAAVSCIPVFEEGSDEAKALEKETNKGGWVYGMPVVELDSEATAACNDHSVYLTMHKDHWKWPEAHEEDPAKEGFSPRGMRAGLSSVIVMSEGSLDAADAVDQWIGTVWHRFPLLEYNIKRFGMAHAKGVEGEVITLDSGSLQEPPIDALEQRYGFIAWPGDGMKNIPRQFAYTEHPNPLEDVGLDFDAQKQTGYPVSLQFTQNVLRNSGGATMKLYEAKKRGGKYENGDEIPCWLHTPDEPLYNRLVLRDVVFVIPKEVLESNTTYKAVVDITYRGVPKKIEWTFTTGTRMQGLGKL